MGRKTDKWRERAEREETGRRERQEGRFPPQRRRGVRPRARKDYAGGASVSVCVCICVARVSGYAAHRKQTAAKIHFPTRTHGNTTTHKAKSRKQKQQKAQ